MKKILSTIIILVAAICLQVTPAKAGMDPFIGEIQMVGFNFAPRGWVICDGRLLPIRQYTALFALLGTTYGGDGINTFAVPDLRARVPIGQGAGPGLTPYNMGQMGGAEFQTLTIGNLPAHTHTATVGGSATGKIMATNDAGTTSDPLGGIFAKPMSGATPVKEYKPVPGPIDLTNSTQLAANHMASMTNSTVLVDPTNIRVNNGVTGGSMPINLMQPYVTVNYIMAVEGIFPARE